MADNGLKCPVCGASNIPGSDQCDSCHAPLAHVDSFASKRGMEKRLLEGRVGDLSPRQALRVSPDEPIPSAARIMREGRVGCLLVMEGERLAGLFSERELLLKAPLDQESLSKTPVRAVMCPETTLLNETDEMAWAFHGMAVSGHLHVPVRLASGGLGVVSARDLLRYLCR